MGDTEVMYYVSCTKSVLPSWVHKTPREVLQYFTQKCKKEKVNVNQKHLSLVMIDWTVKHKMTFFLSFTKITKQTLPIIFLALNLPVSVARSKLPEHS